MRPFPPRHRTAFREPVLDEILEERVVSSRGRKNPTFGNPFGLALYDKKQNGVRGARAKNGNKPNGQEISWIVLSAEGEFVSLHEDPVDYCCSAPGSLDTSLSHAAGLSEIAAYHA